MGKSFCLFDGEGVWYIGDGMSKEVGKSFCLFDGEEVWYIGDRSMSRKESDGTRNRLNIKESGILVIEA